MLTTSKTHTSMNDMIHLLTAIGLSPVAVVQHTFTHKQYIKQHNNNRTTQITTNLEE